MESDTVDLVARVPVVTRAGEGSPERRAGKSWQMGVSEMERKFLNALCTKGHRAQR